MNQVTRIPVQAYSILIQAALFFDELRQRGTDAAIVVPDAFTAETVKKALGLTNKHVFNARAPRKNHWILRNAFPAYVVVNEAQCAEAFNWKFPGEGQFIDLLANRQATFPGAQIYAFTEARPRRSNRARVTTDTRQDTPSVLGPS